MKLKTQDEYNKKADKFVENLARYFVECFADISDQEAFDLKTSNKATFRRLPSDLLKPFNEEGQKILIQSVCDIISKTGFKASYVPSELGQHEGINISK
ncbi:MAG: hypothetical protein KAI67_04985 [Candidatus Pacebacteria bacterium]|nr:hypothetical protein [Candidatus Paceibacterota bacterium]